jgi:nondiscriminating glutamyl-tRNA synthetase
MFSVGDLIREFSLERVNKAWAVFDMAKLEWMNAEYIKAESDDELFAHVERELSELIVAFGDRRVRYALETLRGGVVTYPEIVKRVQDVFEPEPAPDPEMAVLLLEEPVREMIAAFAERMSGLDEAAWNDFDKLESVFKQIALEAGQSKGLKGKALWRSLRAALTGQPHGPELAKLVGIWGRDRVLAQLDRALAQARGVVPFNPIS